MTANDKLAEPVKGKSSLERPYFSPGIVLRDDDLNLGVDYTRNLSRLLFRTLFGCGVVCGLKVTAGFDKCGKLIVTVGDGVALDCRGDPIHVPAPRSISIDPSCGKDIPDSLCVVVRRTEKCCAPRPAACSCDDEETPAACTREQDCYEIRILSECPECSCICPEHEPTGNDPELKSVGAAAAVKTTKKSQAAAKAARAATAPPPTPEGSHPTDCWCVDPESDCYKDHYKGLCSCDCDCEWVVLARLKRIDTNSNPTWSPDHSVRRFVRPVLMRDPVTWEEAQSKS